MWISFRRYEEIQAELRTSARLLSDSLAQSSYYEAKLDAQDSLVKKLETEVEVLRSEKKELLDDLLIASGVKMSKYQEALAQKQLEENGQDQPSFTGQTRQWAAERTRDGMMTQEEKNRRAIEIVEELERSAELNIGGLGNV